MRYSKDHKRETRVSILNAALDGFRGQGYHGIGVDGIAKAAGVTSGAFYKHFASKSAAFRDVVLEGLSILRNGIQENQRVHGRKWLSAFVKYYFSFPKDHARDPLHRALPMEGGCALPTLSPEMPRIDAETRQLFEDELGRIMEAISQGLPEALKEKRRVSWAMLSLMVGGIVLARSVRNDKTATQIAASCAATIKQLTELSSPG